MQKLKYKLRIFWLDLIVWLYLYGPLEVPVVNRFHWLNKYTRNPNGSPRVCYYCGSKKYLKDKVLDRIEYTVAELEVRCTRCDIQVGFWGYGYWDTSL